MNTVRTGHTKQPLARPDALLLPFLAGRRWVNVQQIVRLESEGNYTVFFFTDGSRLMVALTMKRLMTRIQAGQFIRLHRKHIVNRDFITGIRESAFLVDLSNGDAVSIARRRIGLLKQDAAVLKAESGRP